MQLCFSRIRIQTTHAGTDLMAAAAMRAMAHRIRTAITDRIAAAGETVANAVEPTASHRTDEILLVIVRAIGQIEVV